MDVIMPRIYRLGVVTCLAVVVMLVACTGGSEPAAPAETVAVGTTTQPANTLVPAPTATPGTNSRTNGNFGAYNCTHQHSSSYAPTNRDSGVHAPVHKPPDTDCRTKHRRCRRHRDLRRAPGRTRRIVQRYKWR